MLLYQLTLPTDLDAERKKIIPTYNKAGSLEQVRLQYTAGTNTYVESIAYNAKGQRLLIAFGNDVVTRYVYDALTFRLSRQRSEKYAKSTVGNTITYNYVSSSLRQDDSFQYDLIGNIVKLLDRMKDCGIGGTPNALDKNYEYDAIYRLTYADGRESGTQSGNSYLYDDAPAPTDLTQVRAYSRTYSYDKLGNVLNVLQPGTYGFTRHFVYNAGQNTLNKIDTGGGTPSLIEDYTYDANGNQVTAGASRNYIWNHSDQLICYKNQVGISNPTIYTQYDYSGQDRVSKLVRTGTDVNPIYQRTIYIDGIFEYVKLDNGSTYEKNYIHMMDDKSRIAEIRIGDIFPGDISDNIVYFIEDQIGSSVMRTDLSGEEIDREEYYPFGDSSLRTFTYKRYRYVGKEKDAESGLYYYGARYYVAWACRFISVDSAAGKYPDVSSYNYCLNNPIRLVDPDGNAPGGPNDPPKSSAPQTNGTGANKLKGLFTPAKTDPTLKTDNLRAAGTDGKGGSTSQQNETPGEKKPRDTSAPAGHQYPKGTFEGKAADPRPRAAATNNTTGMAGDASNSPLTDQQILESAAQKLGSIELSAGKGLLSGSTSLDLGIEKGPFSVNLNENGDITKVGVGDVMVGSSSVEVGPYAIENSTEISTDINIQHDATGVPTSTTQIDIMVQNRTAQFVAGLASSKVTVVKTTTLSSGQVYGPTVIGVLKQKLVTAGGEITKGLDAQLKVPLPFD